MEITERMEIIKLINQASKKDQYKQSLSNKDINIIDITLTDQSLSNGGTITKRPTKIT